MQHYNYLYFFSYDETESELCKLESRFIFQTKEKDKVLFSNIRIQASNSAFIKRRVEILYSDANYDALLQTIEEAEICADNFKVEYLVLAGDRTEYRKRLEKLKDIGYRIEGEPEYYHPEITFALCCYGGIWYFGTLQKNNYTWQKHNQKPYSYSNSIQINIAKALVNIASQADLEKKLLDTCCGVGTILLEACFAGNHIEACDINWKVCRQARQNLEHFNYSATVYRSDIKDIEGSYDAAIIDLPYNLFSCADEASVNHIIESAAKLANRLVIVSITDISKLIQKVGLQIVDSCSVRKQLKTNFKRQIWVCEKQTANE